LKKAEDADALVMRVYNPAESGEVNDSVQFAAQVTDWAEVSMDEKVRNRDAAGETFGVLKPCQAKSFLATFTK
jgi:mannosylglycerate hydrolase